MNRNDVTELTWHPQPALSGLIELQVFGRVFYIFGKTNATEYYIKEDKGTYYGPCFMTTECMASSETS